MKSKGLIHRVVQTCHSHLVIMLIVWKDGGKRDLLHIVNVAIYLVYQCLLSDPVSGIPKECRNLRGFIWKDVCCS